MTSFTQHFNGEEKRSSAKLPVQIKLLWGPEVGGDPS